MNVRLLRKVAKHISEEPKRFIMGNFVQRREASADGTVYEYACKIPGKNSHKFASCGTAACIAGWAVLLTQGMGADVDRQEAADILGLKGNSMDSESPAYRLFEESAWPTRFRAKYDRAVTPRTRVKIAVARIEHFIKTKGAE